MNRGPLLSALASGVGLLAFAFLVVFPRGAEVASVQSDLAEAEAGLASLQADLASLQTLRDDPAEVARLAALRKSIPTTADLADLLGLLRATADESGVTLASVAPGAPIAASAGASTSIPLAISATGQYFDLVRFLFELEHLERLMKVSSISVQAESQGGQLLSLSLAGEVFTTDLSAGPGSDPAAGAEVGA